MYMAISHLGCLQKSDSEQEDEEDTIPDTASEREWVCTPKPLEDYEEQVSQRCCP